MSTREEQIAGIRQLADLLEQHEELPVPFDLSGGGHVTIHLMSAVDPRGDLAKIVRLLPGKLEKKAWGAGATSYFDVTAHIGPLQLQVTAYREQVCERVVTGTREVTRTIPDPMVTVPVVEVTETVEDVEWVCTPLLAEVDR